MRPKILFIPGWTYTLANVQPLVKALRQRGLVVEILKVPGLTGEPLSSSWDLAAYRRWLEERVCQQNKPLILMGHSNGGRIILSYLSGKTSPQVRGAILLASAGLLDRRPMVLAKKHLLAFLAHLAAPLKHFSWCRRLVYVLIGERDYYLATPVMRQTMANLVAQDLAPVVTKIKVPVLLFWGKRDKATPFYLGQQLAELIPNSWLITYDRAGHNLIATHVSQIVNSIYQHPILWQNLTV